MNASRTPIADRIARNAATTDLPVVYLVTSSGVDGDLTSGKLTWPDAVKLATQISARGTNRAAIMDTRTRTVVAHYVRGAYARFSG